MDAETQLREELTDRALSLCALLGPDLHRKLVAAIDASAPRLVMEAEEPDGAIAIMNALWNSAQPPAEWWKTPLGKLVGRQCDDMFITQQEAAMIRGVKRNTIAMEVHRGTLKSNGTRGIAVSDVIKKIKNDRAE